MAENRTVDLSQHTLDVNRRKYSVDKLDLAEIDDYIRALAGSRDYEYHAIRDILIYLWGGSYESIEELAEENWENKANIRSRFNNNKERFLSTLPMQNKLSGVCHMATGTGKSYVIFAVAYLSILLGKVDRVLVLTPSSTIIKKGLREKFQDYLFGQSSYELKVKLPSQYRLKTVKLIKRNQPPEDKSIMVENINGVYQYFQDKDLNSIAGFFKGTDEVLVLSDEVHHAYSQWDPSKGHFEFDELNKGGRQTDTENERRWMKFIHDAEAKKIKRHIGFTGTPYNKDDYFTDVMFNYPIKRAIEEKYIKDIDPIIEYEEEINKNQRYEQIIITHYENKDKFSYKKDGKPQVKPITVFICNTQKSAERSTEEFSLILAEYLKKNVEEYKHLSRSALEVEARKKVICVVSNTINEVIERFENVEEIDPNKPGGKVEYIFSVQMLTEGWDVDNVFQIVPMEKRAFKSKLLISQVLGRGLRIPRQVRQMDIEQTYPILTVTNHETFTQHIQELLHEVIQSELRFSSRVFESKKFDRYEHHFSLFNVNCVPDKKIVEKDKKDDQTSIPTKLNLEPQSRELSMKVRYEKGTRQFDLSKEFFTIDQVVSEVNNKFKTEAFERKNFDFGDDFDSDHVPEFNEIKEFIKCAMDEAGIEGNELGRENRDRIRLFFNQYLPSGKSKSVPTRIEGNVVGLSTKNMPGSSTNAGGLDNFVSIFLSEEYREELSDSDLQNLEELRVAKKEMGHEGGPTLFDKDFDFNDRYIRALYPDKNVFIVNQSMFRTPQDMVIVSHKPERQFLFKLIDNSKLIDSWIKSPDKGYYSLDYTFWKGGKDRVVRSFNPDFFIKINLDEYLSNISEDGDRDQIIELQEQGYKELVLVVEIKGDIEMNERVARAKEEAGKEHFKGLTERLKDENPIDFEEEFRSSSKQYYRFFLLHPKDYDYWFERLERGEIIKTILGQ
jgi:type III restriction enzyme